MDSGREQSSTPKSHKGHKAAPSNMAFKHSFHFMVALGLNSACAVPAYDLFEQSQIEMASSVGEWCTLNPHVPARNEVSLAEQPENCGDYGLCLGIGPEHETLQVVEMCSCRCDGDPVNAPFCACPDGYSCEDMFPSIQELKGPDPYEGSYCIPLEQLKSGY